MAWIEDAAKSTIPPGSRVALYLHTAMACQDGRAAEIDRQRNKLVHFCDERFCVIPIEFSDVGRCESGRSGLKDLIAAATSDGRPFDVVLVDSFSALSRSVTKLRSILHRLAEVGVNVISLSEASELVGMIKLEMQSSQSQRQSQIMRRARARRKAEAVNSGASALRQTKVKCAACEGRGWTEATS